MREFFHSVKFKIILCIAALLLGLITYVAVAAGTQTLPEQVISTVTYPFVTAANAISNGVNGFIDKWVNADTSGNYETALTALMNLGENYWFRLPASLVGKISASNNTAARSVTYTEVVTGEDGSQLLGSPLFTIRVFTRSAWDSRGETSGYEQLAAQGDLVFGIQTLTQDAEHLRAIAQIRSQFHVTLE